MRLARAGKAGLNAGPRFAEITRARNLQSAGGQRRAIAWLILARFIEASRIPIAGYRPPPPLRVTASTKWNVVPGGTGAAVRPYGQHRLDVSYPDYRPREYVPCSAGVRGPHRHRPEPPSAAIILSRIVDQHVSLEADDVLFVR
jgi:hypothetical protein